MTVEGQKHIAGEVQRAIDNHDAKAVPVLLQALELSALEAGALSEAALDLLLHAVSSDSVRQPQAWLVLKFLDDNWEFLEGDRKQALLSLVVGAFEQFDDWMGAFFVPDLVGRRYATTEGLEALRSLSRATAHVPRSLVPSGIAQFVRQAPSEDIARDAISLLRTMNADPVENVRDEAAKYIEQLSRDGLIGK